VLHVARGRARDIVEIDEEVVGFGSARQILLIEDLTGDAEHHVGFGGLEDLALGQRLPEFQIGEVGSGQIGAEPGDARAM